jgi:hypothetical protein
MGSWIALVGSIIIGGLILMSFQEFQGDVTRDLYVNTIENMTYNNLDGVTSLVEYDFSRIGAGINDPSAAVVTQADSAEVRYRLDSDGNGVPENMRYYLSSVSAAAMTPNPNDRLLLRQFNGGTPDTVAAGVRNFKIAYYDSVGSVPATNFAIRTFVVTLTLESAFGYDNQYPRFVWQKRITPTSLVIY